MRKWKMALAGVLSLFMVEAPAVCSMPVYSVAAAETTVQDTDVLKGLVKENGKYYYYVDGKMQKGWQNVTTTKSNGQSVTYRYYFGANGAAYAATPKQKTLVKKISGKYYGFNSLGRARTNTFCNVKLKKGKKTFTYRYYFGANGAAYAGKKSYGTAEIAVKKIKGKYYGFNLNGNMVKGTWVKGGKFYVFGKNGVYNASLSKKLRAAAGYEKEASTLLSLIGNPKKVQVLENTCYGDGTEMYYYYDNYFADIFKFGGTGKTIVLGVSAK